MVPRRAVAGRSRQRRLLGNAVLNISELWHGAADVAKAVKIHRHSASRSQPPHGSAPSGACSADGGLSAAAPNALLHVGARPLGVFPTVRCAWPRYKPTAQRCTRSPHGAAELDSIQAPSRFRSVMAGIALDAATARHAPSELAITAAAEADRFGVDRAGRAAGRRARRVGRAQVCAAITLGSRRCPCLPACLPTTPQAFCAHMSIQPTRSVFTLHAHTQRCRPPSLHAIPYQRCPQPCACVLCRPAPRKLESSTLSAHSHCSGTLLRTRVL